MSVSIDARLMVRFGSPAEAGAEDALLREGQGESAPGQEWFQPDAASAAHPAGCACCAPRGGAAMALARLMLARGRGTGRFFRRVVAVTETDSGRQAVLDALADDPLASGCFRLDAEKAEQLGDYVIPPRPPA